MTTEATDAASAQQALKYITQAIAEAERAAEAARKKVELLRLAAQTIADAVSVEAETPPSANGQDPVHSRLADQLAEIERNREQVPLSTVEAVRTILRQKPGEFFSVKALVHLMQTQGLLRTDLKEPRNTVLEAAKRLERRSDHVERLDRDGMALFRLVAMDFDKVVEQSIDEAKEKRQVAF